MSSRPHTPTAASSIPSADHNPLSASSGTNYSTDTRPTTAQSSVRDQPQHTAMDDSTGGQRSASRASTAAGDGVARSNTLKKRGSVKRTGSLKRSSSRKSLRAGSIKGMTIGDGPINHEDYNSAFYTPIPTDSSPTDILANRFQAWRAFLKSLVTYFREIQGSYETRAKAVMKVSNVIGNIQPPSVFLTDGGLSDAHRILNDYHKHSLSEANKARDIEQDVIQALNGLRADLGAKIKEIKSLSGDFKNSVEKEKGSTKKAVTALHEALEHYEHNDGLDKGRSDPFIVRLNVDRMVEKQIDEENYLHRAYLNLENSGRELESIVVGEIQKAYNAYAGIIKREADENYSTVELLRSGPISMQKDLEWSQFVSRDPHLVDSDLPLRKLQDITYPGKFHPAAAEIRAGMLERKSKYLKSYSAGWYVLSPTHLHEFKSADNIYSQPPVMSLYLAEQKLGSHSGADSSSHKFMLKGRQSGGMHRGHSWVFRAESHDTMMAWFDAIKSLTEKTGMEKSEYVRKHARSVSGNSARALSISSDGMEEDEADDVPYAASIIGHQVEQPVEGQRLQRPQPGGRFPSDLALPGVHQRSASDYSSEPELDPYSPVLSQTTQSDAWEPIHQQATTSYVDTSVNPYALSGVATHTTRADEREHKDRVASDAPLLVSQQSHLGSDASQAGHHSQNLSPVQSTATADHVHDSQPTGARTFELPLHPAPTSQVQPQSYTSELPHNRDTATERGAMLSPSGGTTVDAAFGNHSYDSAQQPTSRFSMSTRQSVDTDLTESTQPSTLHEASVAKANPLARQATDVSVSALHVPGEYPNVDGKAAPTIKGGRT